jgi:hypothetical protein
MSLQDPTQHPKYCFFDSKREFYQMLQTIFPNLFAGISVVPSEIPVVLFLLKAPVIFSFAEFLSESFLLR